MVFLFNLSVSLIILIILYYKNYIQKDNESNENIEDENFNFGKIIYDSFLVFHIYFLFYNLKN